MNSNDRILFEKPDLKRLRSDYMVVDMHFHSHYSDGLNSVREIAQKAVELGIGVAITDHNDIRGAVELNTRPEVFSIPGMEVTSVEGTHLLVYFAEIETLIRFFEDGIRPYRGRHVMSCISLTMEEIIERAREHGAMIVFPHPYSVVYTGIHNAHFDEMRLKRLFRSADGVEVINASNLGKWNLKSALLGFNLGKAITGGSDGHDIRHLGRAVSYAKCHKERRAFLKAVLKGASKVIGKEMSLIRKVTANRHKLKINFQNYPDIVDRNLRYSYCYINNKSRSVRANVRRGLDETIAWFCEGHD